ncbi:glutathione S-transferase D4-like [Pollicipes pollicipes]|uniref:glutathione S-transferase D4-like n=1 Tax=Pollicipes pollicipes TaxID=41117 RepID=UPI001884B34E|nr:glutathione S-transferase D4-like [Pollicipes pollicipes]XP_037078343.1 glutathione S-transferase D4-like [Pollicipes pollicipes]
MELMYSPMSTSCRAVLMCIKEMKLKVDLKKMDIQRKMEHMMAWFVKLNPQHTVPTLEDNGFILWESRAILQYLVSAHGRPEYDHLYPANDHQRRATIDRLLQFDLVTLNRAILEYFEPVIHHGHAPDDTKANALKQSLDYLDRFLEGHYAVGDRLSIADLSLLATVSRLQAHNYRTDSYARLRTWQAHLQATLPYYDECNREGMEMYRQMLEQRKQ